MFYFWVNNSIFDISFSLSQYTMAQFTLLEAGLEVMGEGGGEEARKAAMPSKTRVGLRRVGRSKGRF